MVETQQTLLEEMAALREEVAALRAAMGRAVKIEIDAGHAELFLGQPATLEVTVRDAFTGRPMPELDLSAVTSWGDLHTVRDFRSRRGSAVVTRTGIDGRARFILRPAVAGLVESQQQTALEAALRHLDATAATPAGDRAGFDFLIRQYRWEPNVQLRGAVDAYFQLHRQEIAAHLNGRDALQRWQLIDAAVQVAVLPADGGGIGSAGALCVVSFKNWLPPWLQSFRQSARAAGELEQEFEREKAQQPEPNRLLEGVYGRVRRFVDQQYGIVGEFVGQRTAKEALRNFLTEGIADLPDESRRALFPAVEIASATVEREGVNVLSALTQARVDLRREVDDKVAAIDLSGVAALGERLGSLESSVTGKLDAAAFDAFRQTNATELGRKLNVGAFNAFQQNVNSRFDGLVAQDVFDGFRDEVNGTLTGKLDSQAFTDFQASVDGRLGTKADMEQVEQFQREALTALNGKLDANQFARFERDINDRLGNLIPRPSFEQFQQETRATLDEKVDQRDFAGFREATAAELGRKVDLDAHGALNRDLATLLANVKDLDRNVTRLAGNVRLDPGVIIRPIFQ